MTDASNSHPRPAARAAASPPPTLPTCLIELTLIFSALIHPFSPKSTPDLLTVLPRTAVPLVHPFAIRAAELGSSPNNPLALGPLITKSTPDESIDFIANGLVPHLRPYYSATRQALASALSRVGKHTVLARLRAQGVQMGDCWDGPVAAAAFGCLETLKWWKQVLKMPIQMIVRECDDVVVEESGQLEIEDKKRAQLYRRMRNAAIKHGHLQILFHLRSAIPGFAWTKGAWEVASDAGQVVLKWAKMRSYVLPANGTLHAMDYASAAGRVDVLQWWFNNYEVEQLEYTVRAMDDASANNHLAVLNWWSRSGLPLKFTPAAKMQAMRAGHIDVVRFWLECGEYKFMARSDSPLGPNTRIPPRLQDADPAMLAAFDRLKWMARPGQPEMSALKLAEVCSMAAKLGQVHVLVHLEPTLKGARNLEFKRDAHPLILAAAHGHLGCLQWLLSVLDGGELYSADLTVRVVLDEAATQAAAQGHVHIMEWMLSNSVVRPIILQTSYPISIALENGSVALLELLFADKMFHDSSDMSVQPSLFGLRTAAAKGYVHVFEWFARRNLSWKEPRGPFYADLVAEALKHSQISLLDWWLQHPRWIIWRVDEVVVAHLVVARNWASLKWLNDHASVVRLSCWAVRRIRDYESESR